MSDSRQQEDLRIRKVMRRANSIKGFCEFFSPRAVAELGPKLVLH